MARRIVRALRPHAVWVTLPDEPSVTRIANIQHLASPARAQLARPVGAIELAGLLHPTPAVGGEPWDRAAPLIRALEGIDRGWFAGPVGWADQNVRMASLCVALRSALVAGADARLFRGRRKWWRTSIRLLSWPRLSRSSPRCWACWRCRRFCGALAVASAARL